MLNTSLARPALMVMAFAALAACHKNAASTTPAPAARPFTAAMVAEGDSVFHARGCKNCHGMDGKRAQNGPNLTGKTFLHVDGSFEGFERIITSGVPANQIKDPEHKRPMGARGGGPTPLSDAQIKSVAAYVYTLSHP